ncbi:MAG TPA: cytidylate kinase [Lachnospiraceae bacterium]|nr:cytidylate kinase [Lachnospiraceae bacterium]
MTVCIRGAITAENTKEEILSATKELLTKIIRENAIELKDIISVFFTMTKDMDAVYPAVAARQIGIVHAALMCFDELEIKGSLTKCIRVAMTVNSELKQDEVTHVYMKGATVLRPDITQKKDAVAIDGPAGSGKSTLAKLLAAKMGYIYVDTGAMYRAFGLFCKNKGISIENVETSEKYLSETDIELGFKDGQTRVFLNGADVTDDIRTQEIAAYASAVAKLGFVREYLGNKQKAIANEKKVVMDGRDIGTNVIPNAKVKLYIDASEKVRADRRMKELEQKGIKGDFDTIYQEVVQRDKNDRERKINPLTVAKDAVVIDTSDMSAEKVLDEVLKIIKENGLWK